MLSLHKFGKSNWTCRVVRFYLFRGRHNPTGSQANAECCLHNTHRANSVWEIDQKVKHVNEIKIRQANGNLFKLWAVGTHFDYLNRCQTSTNDQLWPRTDARWPLCRLFAVLEYTRYPVRLGQEGRIDDGEAETSTKSMQLKERRKENR